MNVNLQDHFQRYDKARIERDCREALHNSQVDFYSAFEAARKKTMEYARSRGRRYITRNSMPLQQYDNMVGILYDLYPDLMREDKYRCPYLLLSPSIRVYPKKLDEKYLPGNIVTDHVKEKRSQELFYEEGIHVLCAGPVLVEDDWMRDFKGYYATFVNEYYPKRPEFIIDLKDYIKTAVVPVEVPAQETQLVKVPKTGTEDAGTAKAK